MYQAYKEKMITFQSNLLFFISNDDRMEEYYHNIINFFKEEEIHENNHYLKSILQLISNIADNYHRGPNFFDKIEKILQYLKDDILSKFSNYEIFDIFNKNKILILFLIDEKMIEIDKFIAEKMNKDLFFFPEIKPFLDEPENTNKEVISDSNIDQTNDQIDLENIIIDDTDFSSDEFDFDEFEYISNDFDIFFESPYYTSTKNRKTPINTNNSNTKNRKTPINTNNSSTENRKTLFNTNDSSTENRKTPINTNKSSTNKPQTPINTNKNFHNYPRIRKQRRLNNNNNNINNHDTKNDQINLFEYDLPKDFNEKRKIGENDQFICKLIREDSIEQFIIYVNKNDYSIKSEIESSIYETNNFLIGKKPTLIEYATFFGSLSIFKYLYKNGIKLTSSLWMYAIHGDHPEIINILEENNIIPEDKTFQQCMEEAIKCYHNDAANYIRDNFYYKTIAADRDVKIFLLSLRYQNYNFFPDEIKDTLLFRAACQYNDFYIIETILENKIINTKELDFLLSYAIEKNDIEIIDLYLRHIGIIDSYCFQNCTNLTKIIIPYSVTSIGHHSFINCKSLIEIVIPPSINLIEDHAFYNCNSLKKISIPSSVTSIGDYALAECSSLIEVSLGKIKKIGKNIFQGVFSIELNGSIDRIPTEMFSNNTSLKEIKIVASILSIEEFAFTDCLELTKISIPSSVCTIGIGAFNNCQKLKFVSFENPSSLNVIEDSTFVNCQSLDQIIIPDSVTEIKDNVFLNCISLNLISISANVTSFGCNIFEGVQKLEIFGNLNYIPKNLFSNNSSLLEITLPKSVPIAEDFFEGCSPQLKINK